MSSARAVTTDNNDAVSPRYNLPNVPLRQLGTNGPLVPALSLGLMSFANVYGSSPQEERFALLDRAHEIGSRLWDTADMYGDSEATIGAWFEKTGKRKDIFLATKFGYIKGDPNYSVRSDGKFARAACEESLRILKTDWIDLYYAHHPNADTPIEETMRALVDLQKEGKIKHIGLSNMSARTLRRAVAIAPVAAVQIEYSLFTLDIERPQTSHLLSVCRELGVAIIAYSPLGRGILTSTFASNKPTADERDIRPKMLPRFQGSNRDDNAKLVQKFGKIAQKKGCSTSQLALAWVLKQGDEVIPTPGTKTVAYLESNWAALKVQLTDDEEREIRSFAEGMEVKGPPIPEAMIHRLYTDTEEEGS